MVSAIERRCADDLSEAIEMLFPMDTDDAIIDWDGYKLSLSYKYDISVIIDDVLYMFKKLIKGEDKNIVVAFGSNTFSVDWKIECVSETLKINSKWTSVVGNIEPELNLLPDMEIPKDSFIENWIQILLTINQAIGKTQITMKDSSAIDQLKEIVQMYNIKGELRGHNT